MAGGWNQSSTHNKPLSFLEIQQEQEKQVFRVKEAGVIVGSVTNRTQQKTNVSIDNIKIKYEIII